MSVVDLLQFLTQALFILIFLVVAVDAARRPRRSKVDTVLLFGALSLIIAAGWATASSPPLRHNAGVMVATQSLLMALPYLLLRLVDGFTIVPRPLLRLAEVGLAVAVVTFVVVPPSAQTGPLLAFYLLYFVGLTLYGAAAFVRAARRSGGVTRRRMQAVAFGSLCLALAIFLVGVMAAVKASAPNLAGWLAVIEQFCALGCGLGYAIGFAPPRWLRRAWQEPEVRAFLGRAASLPRLPTTAAIVRELERGAATSLGAPHAAIGLWDEETGVLAYDIDGARVERAPDDDSIVNRAFARQRPLFSANAARDDPTRADAYRAHNAGAVLAVPITAGTKRLGALAVYAARAPIFADDDLVLAQLLADQAAVILESRALIDEAARVRAHDEATRLKDDFLSAAAHDLKTPLAALIMQAQLLERRARLHPDTPADATGIGRMVKEAQRLKTLVVDLLDVSRVEQGKLVGKREDVDLVAMAREACARHSSDHHRCVLDADNAVIGYYDPTRIAQLVDNLLDNAVKYSPEGGDVRVTVRRADDEARLDVADQGIGIPTTDLPHLFERFHRGVNVDDRRFAGMGLGLFICRGIAEQHGGRLWATSPGLGKGSVFHVALPLTAPDAAPLDDPVHGHASPPIRLSV